MTRIFTEGFEMGDTLFIESGARDIVSGGRSGNYSFRPTGGTGYRYFDPISEAYTRWAFKAGANGYTPYVRFVYGSNFIGGFYVNSSGYPQAIVNVNTVVATGPLPVCYYGGVWYLVEMYYKIADSSGSIVIKVDGVEQISYTGDTKPGSDTTFNTIGWTDSGGYVYYDDLALNDTNGSVDNSWCGDGWIIRLAPSGSSATTNDWLNSGSVSGSANYLYVDEVPQDSDTTYTYVSASSTGTQDQYALSDFTGAARSDILRIWAETRAKMATTGSDVIKLGYLPSGGTDQLSGSISLTTSYARYVGTSASVNPVTGLAWTISDINGLEYVIEVG